MSSTPILAGKRVLVTGGTGSLGQVLVRRILAGELGEPSQIVILSRDEAKQHDMRIAYHAAMGGGNSQRAGRLDFRIGDIRSFGDVCAALQGVQVVINAAALKQVPSCEYFPEQAVLTNCMGPANIVRAIREHQLPVEIVVGISTDKACKPVNVMGMTKSLHERIFISGNYHCPGTRFVCARYGNVLASRGSVIPLFREQVIRGGPVTVTHPQMTRFLMSLDDAIDCVFAALQNARRGETYIPRMPTATVLNVAKALIGNRDLPIRLTGIRPGEKLHEIMVSEEERLLCEERGHYFVIRPMLPELRDDSASESAKEVVLPFWKEYSSADGLIDMEETRELLARNHLLVEDSAILVGKRLRLAAA